MTCAMPISSSASSESVTMVPTSSVASPGYHPTCCAPTVASFATRPAPGPDGRAEFISDDVLRLMLGVPAAPGLGADSARSAFARWARGSIILPCARAGAPGTLQNLPRLRRRPHVARAAAERHRRHRWADHHRAWRRPGQDGPAAVYAVVGRRARLAPPRRAGDGATEEHGRGALQLGRVRDGPDGDRAARRAYLSTRTARRCTSTAAAASSRIRRRWRAR